MAQGNQDDALKARENREFYEGHSKKTNKAVLYAAGGVLACMTAVSAGGGVLISGASVAAKVVTGVVAALTAVGGFALLRASNKAAYEAQDLEHEHVAKLAAANVAKELAKAQAKEHEPEAAQAGRADGKSWAQSFNERANAPDFFLKSTGGLL